MAKLFPEKPFEIPEYSKEDLIFESLAKLPDDYYIFHSFNIVNIKNNGIEESETDFVIFNPDKGIICLEAKAGKNIKYKNNVWYYGSGIEMKHGGPFNQVQKNKYNLIQQFKEHNLGDILQNCKFVHAVWFPDITFNDLSHLNLPLEAEKKLVLTQEALQDTEKYIDKIFNINIHNIETNLSQYDVNRILKNILCPAFNLAAAGSSNLQYKEIVYKRLITEQINVLNYIEEQRTAIINGAAGTGKTFIALEKARRCAEKEDKVLFLCYNRLLCDYLKNNYKNDNICFYTIDKLACRICGTKTADYNDLSNKLYDYIETKDFPWQHVIIDEGQDFGRSNIEEANIIEYLEEIIRSNDERNGTFYIFYDKNQMINSDNIPTYLKDADCKLTLYRNCRNTKNIAITSTRVLGDKIKPNVYFDFVDTTKPKLYIANRKLPVIGLLDIVISKVKQRYKSIVILTAATENKSVLTPYLVDNQYKHIPFYTCRRFKGLEADAIILVDINKNMFTSDRLIFYTGSSRAKYDLSIICDLSENDCKDILTALNFPSTNRNVLKSFASKLNVEIVKQNDT